MYLAPACTFWLFLGSMLLEFRNMVADGAFGLMVSPLCRAARCCAARCCASALGSLLECRKMAAECAVGCLV